MKEDGGGRRRVTSENLRRLLEHGTGPGGFRAHGTGPALKATPKVPPTHRDSTPALGPPYESKPVQVGGLAFWLVCPCWSCVWA